MPNYPSFTFGGVTYGTTPAPGGGYQFVDPSGTALPGYLSPSGNITWKGQNVGQTVGTGVRWNDPSWAGQGGVLTPATPSVAPTSAFPAIPGEAPLTAAPTTTAPTFDPNNPATWDLSPGSPLGQNIANLSPWLGSLGVTPEQAPGFLQSLWYQGLAGVSPDQQLWFNPTPGDISGRTTNPYVATRQYLNPEPIMPAVPEGPTTYTTTSGINWSDPLAQSLQGQLIEGATGLPQLASEYGQSLQDYYTNLMRESLGPQAFQGTLNQLAGRNILSSSVAGDTLAKTAADIMRNVGQQAYESRARGLSQEMAVPGMLADIAGLARTQQTIDPLASYNILAQLLSGGLYD